MTPIRPLLLLISSLSAVLLSGCEQAADTPATAAVPYEDELRLALETAKSGDVIVIPEGTHKFTRSLTLNTDGVTIRGSGMDKSVLSFA